MTSLFPGGDSLSKDGEEASVAGGSLEGAALVRARVDLSSARTRLQAALVHQSLGGSPIPALGKTLLCLGWMCAGTCRGAWPCPLCCSCWQPAPALGRPSGLSPGRDPALNLLPGWHLMAGASAEESLLALGCVCGRCWQRQDGVAVCWVRARSGGTGQSPNWCPSALPS